MIAAEMHDSTRVHLQFNGRSGRQGEFGETVSFLSLEDRLLNLRAGEILRLSRRLGVDAIGREYFSGDAVANLVAGLRRDSEREGEAQRGLMQDYFAVPDLQTRLFYRRRQQVIGSSRIRDKCREIAFLQASGLVNRYLDRSTHDLYSRQFGRLAEEAALDYGVNCSDLYGCALDILPEEIGRILAGKLDESSACAGPGLFEETARLLYLQTSDGLWREHLTRLRDSMSNHILGARSHKSAVAAYVRYSSRAWDEFWEQVDSEFLVKLAAFPFSSPGLELERPTPASEQSVSEQVEMLLAELPRPAVPPAVLMEAAARSD